jgi:hypothetical protein
MTLTITDSTDESIVPNQTVQLIYNEAGGWWSNVYDLGEDYGGVGAGVYTHDCQGTEEDPVWTYDANEALALPYDSETCDPGFWQVSHTTIALPPCTATYTVTE